MAEALLLGAVADRIVYLLYEQGRYRVNLVGGSEVELHNICYGLSMIREMLDDAEIKSFQDEHISSWLWKLRQATYEMEDILDEWEYALLKLQREKQPLKKKACSFIPSSSFSCFKKVGVRHDIANRILRVNERLDEILKQRHSSGFTISEIRADLLPQSWHRRSTSLIDSREVHGRVAERDLLINKLIGDGGSQEGSGIQVVSILGMGGLGKTTLAQLVYNDDRVRASFEQRIWICVSDPFDPSVIGKGILRSITGGGYGDVGQLDDLFGCVRVSISGKKILLVLDDVWTEDYEKWKPLQNILKYCGAGSQILVTTRNQRVAEVMGTTMDNEVFRLGFLSEEDCWSILCRMAALSEGDRGKYEDIGMEIAKKCSGLPLAATTLGGILRFKRSYEEWKYVLDSEIWKMPKAEYELFCPLLMSYKELSPTQKLCFSYCAFYPKDFVIDVESLIRNWMALGYLGLYSGDMELKGRKCFNVLANRSLFQDFQKNDLDEIYRCKMHDIVHSFARYLREDYEVKGGEMNKSKHCRVCDPSQVYNVNEFCTLDWNEESPPNLCSCFIRSRVLSLARCGMKSVPQEIENLIHLRCLKLRENYFSTTGFKIIFQLYYLQTLDLCDCNLEEIPPEIENLFHLRHLNLSYNRLEVLPSNIGYLKELRHLNLSYNRLEVLPSKIGNLKEVRRLDLSWNEPLKELPYEIGNLFQLTHLNLSGNKSLKELPYRIGKLIHLTHLDLSWNESLKELPNRIGKLIRLTHLDLSWNESLKELPNEIGNLIQLTHLNLSGNKSLKELPESIRALQKLETLKFVGCTSILKLPEGLGQLTALHSIGDHLVLRGLGQFRLLKKLNHLSESLELNLHSSNLDGTVEDAREAKLKKKINIETLAIYFEDRRDESSSSRVDMDVMDALEPHPNLKVLRIENFVGSSFILWMVSPLYQLRKLIINNCCGLTSLPSFGKLPCLKEFRADGLKALQYVGREFLGITTQGAVEGESSSNIAFPKLESLVIIDCDEWKEWEDITAEEEESTAIQIMPCLTELYIFKCKALTTLPHRLLRKASSLEMLGLNSSKKLEQRYNNMDVVISLNNPHLELL